MEFIFDEIAKTTVLSRLAMSPVFELPKISQIRSLQPELEQKEKYFCFDNFYRGRVSYRPALVRGGVRGFVWARAVPYQANWKEYLQY